MKKILICLGLALSLFANSVFAASTQVDSLIEKLVEKGILTKGEAIKLKAEVASDEKVVREESAKQILPEWVQKTKLKGDFRLRYQYERKQNDADARSRGRIRYRLGLETQPNEQVKIAAGLASSNSDGSTTDDPRSTNQTFENSFSRGNVRLDYAFAEYAPGDWLKLAGGKILSKDYLWNPTDMLWDSDINPAGAALHWEHKLNDQWKAFNNLGVWLIDENGSTDKPDPFMHYVQSGVKFTKPQFDAQGAVIYYGFNGVKGTDLDNEKNTNTQIGGVADAGLKYDYDSIGGSFEIGANELFHGLPFKIDDRIALFGDYIYNFETFGPSDNEIDNNIGWSVGAKFGHNKVNTKGQWQFKYIFANLERDAFPDIFPDSDRYGGSTDVRSHEAIFELGLNKNMSVALDYYNSRRLKAVPHNAEQVIQADLNFKF